MSAAVEALAEFRASKGPDKSLLDLEAWLQSKITILKRRVRRKSSFRVRTSIAELTSLMQEVHSMRFDVIARRCAMPRMTLFGGEEHTNV